ncbi:hypothetical protein BDV26DRAFT_276682 [Aspergillus bertholletiae]|uniref:Uncharacterized protein n=1 Tax=Aspergillus bertholletiae TaxID=1226010 RepID=A0A5N7AMU7_9EURO|nr:hypothetical protein BDV26DRAFT_276682 [Aspergillus bertholletiae]
MPTPKTDAEYRVSEPTVQQRQLQNPPQNQASASIWLGASRAAGISQEEDPTSRMTLQEFLQAGVDKNGNSVPDPTTFTDSAEIHRGGSQAQDEADLADGAYYDDFD